LFKVIENGVGKAGVSYARYCPQQLPYVLSNVTEDVRIVSALTEFGTVYIQNNEQVLAAF
jgi:hypothetical protein